MLPPPPPTSPDALVQAIGADGGTTWAVLINVNGKHMEPSAAVGLPTVPFPAAPTSVHVVVPGFLDCVFVTTDPGTGSAGVYCPSVPMPSTTTVSFSPQAAFPAPVGYAAPGMPALLDIGGDGDADVVLLAPRASSGILDTLLYTNE